MAISEAYWVKIIIRRSCRISVIYVYRKKALVSGCSDLVYINEFGYFFLIHLLWQVSHKDISLAVKVAVFLLVQDNLFSIDFGVVHCVQASESFIQCVEVEISESP